VRVLGGVFVGDEQEPAGATRRVHDRVTRPRVDHLHDRLDQIPRSEVLPSARTLIRGTKLEDLVGLCVWRR
jgi:hypothetical protein